MQDKVRIMLKKKQKCGLCEEMKSEMKKAGVENLYTLEEVDIEKHAELFTRYRYEIPVLLINGPLFRLLLFARARTHIGACAAPQLDVRHVKGAAEGFEVKLAGVGTQPGPSATVGKIEGSASAMIGVAGRGSGKPPPPR